MKAVRTGKKAGGRSSTPAATRPRDGVPPLALPLAQLVDELAAAMRRHDLSELEVQDAALRVHLRRGAVVMAPTAEVVTPSPVEPMAPAPAEPPPTAETSDGNVSYITSPFVGTFYRSPSPELAPFVDEGTRVKKGQVICIVEAMKLMNEIEAEVDGIIVACLVENGHAVEYGEPLFKIKQG